MDSLDDPSETDANNYERITFYSGAALYGGDEPFEILLDPHAWQALNDPKSERYTWVWGIVIFSCEDDSE